MSEQESRPALQGSALRLLGVGLAAGAGVALVAARRTAGRMPHLAAWTPLLADRHGQAAADDLTARIQARYTALYPQRPALVDRHPALRDYHFAQAILPGVALYQVLSEDNRDRDAVLEEVAALFEAEYLGLRRVLHAFAQLPPSFNRFRWITRQVMRVAFPAAGWETEWIEDSPRRIAFNMRRCFYLDVLTHYGVPELTALYCRLDDLIYQALPPYVRFERGGTLGRGDAACDFAYVQTNGEIPIPMD